MHFVAINVVTTSTPWPPPFSCNLPHFSVTAGFIYMKERPLLEMPTVMDVSVDGAVKAFLQTNGAFCSGRYKRISLWFGRRGRSESGPS
jgi:hypothetical protein